MAPCLQKQNRYMRRHDLGLAAPAYGIDRPLVDPVFQDADEPTRRYMNYFTSRLCQDLVVHDVNSSVNPFRELVAMSGRHPFLRHIVTAASAVHFSAALRRAACPGQEAMATDALVEALRARHHAIIALQDVLARQKTLENGDPVTTCVSVSDKGEKDALFATIVFFINFTLIDSGRNDWRTHFEAAGRFVLDQTTNPRILSNDVSSSSSIDYVPFEYLPSPPQEDSDQADPFLTYLKPDAGKHDTTVQPGLPGARDYVASDFVAYYIWSCALETIVSTTSRSHQQITSFDIEPDEVLRILLRTEHNSYHSCPAYLFHLILRISLVARSISAQPLRRPEQAQLDELVRLLQEAQNFDVEAWAARICAYNRAVYGVVDDQEYPERMHMASTYRATACLFVLLAAPEVHSHIANLFMNPSSSDATMSSSDNVSGDGQNKDSGASVPLPFLPGSSDFAAVILDSLSRIPSSSPLFKYTTWPVFMAGVETRDPVRRDWALTRLRAMFDICPWGMLRSAMNTLEDIWQLRDLAGKRYNVPHVGSLGGEKDDTLDREDDLWVKMEDGPVQEEKTGLAETRGSFELKIKRRIGGPNNCDGSSSSAMPVPSHSPTRLKISSENGFDETYDVDDDGDFGIDSKWLAKLRELRIDCLIV